MSQVTYGDFTERLVLLLEEYPLFVIPTVLQSWFLFVKWFLIPKESGKNQVGAV